MANDLLEDLIRQVQRATRAESGLSKFDPTQPLPPLPSISDTVASLDPSPPELRCKNCKGRLLRGLKSVICVYCGRPNDVVHDPICFKDTIAYRWLLDSLHLDGSEIVEPTLERGDSGRGKSRPDGEIQVSDLLDFKIIWPTKELSIENASSQKVEEGTFFKFPGIDLDNFFYDSRGLDQDAQKKPEEFQVARNDVVTAETNATSTNNLSFFETIASSESAVQSSNNQENDDFSGWEADFQSSNTGKQFDGSKSSELSVNSTVAPANNQETPKQESPPSGSSVDISSHLDTVFGSVKDDSAASPSISDWTSQHTWDEFNPEPTLETKQPDPLATTEDAFPGDSMSNVDLSDQLDSMFGGSRQEISSFTSGHSKSDWTSDDIWDSLSSKTYQAPVTILGSTDTLPQETRKNPSSSSDWFELDQWQKSTNEPGNNVISVDEVATGGWDDFTSSVPIMTNNAPAESQMQSIAASGSTSESLLFNSENNMEEIDFGSFSRADLIRAPSAKSTQSTADSERAVHINNSTGESLVLTDTMEDVNKVSTQTREDVEMLLSEMHDLSFMLEDKLSFPPKPDGSNVF